MHGVRRDVSVRNDDGVRVVDVLFPVGCKWGAEASYSAHSFAYGIVYNLGAFFVGVVIYGSVFGNSGTGSGLQDGAYCVGGKYSFTGQSAFRL